VTLKFALRLLQTNPQLNKLTLSLLTLQLRKKLKKLLLQPKLPRLLRLPPLKLLPANNFAVTQAIHRSADARRLLAMTCLY
jgi:hypothetical protein